MESPIQLPPALFLPDLPDYPGAGSSSIFNVYPRVQVESPSATSGGRISYGPIGQPMPQYGALNSRCQGGTAVRNSNGATFIFAGSGSDLYLLKAGLSDWQNASKSNGAYAVSSDDMWQFAYFNGDMFAMAFGNPLQYFNLVSGSTFSDSPGNPPMARYMTVVKNAFVVLGNTYDPTNGNMPQRVWWSAAGNAKADGWPDPGSNLAAQVESGAVDLLGPGGWVQGFAADLVNADAVVFQEYAIRRMQYTGTPVFSFLPLENAQGTPAPNSIVVRGGLAYYWGWDGVYVLDGSVSQPIGANKVDRFLFGENGQPGDVDIRNTHRIVGAIDPLRRVIMWAYPSSNATAGNPDRILVYNWVLSEFSLITGIVCETLLRFLSIGYTLDELYTILGYTLDGVPAPLDSSIWLGGKLQLGVIDDSHRLNFLTGTPLEATIETSEMQPEPGKRFLITNSRPLIDVNTPQQNQGTSGQQQPHRTTINLTISIGHRETQQSSVSYSQKFTLNSLGTVPGRASGMYVRERCVIPAGTTTWTNFTGIEITGVVQGNR